VLFFLLGVFFFFFFVFLGGGFFVCVFGVGLFFGVFVGGFGLLEPPRSFGSDELL